MGGIDEARDAESEPARDITGSICDEFDCRDGFVDDDDDDDDGFDANARLRFVCFAGARFTRLEFEKYCEESDKDASTVLDEDMEDIDKVMPWSSSSVS